MAHRCLRPLLALGVVLAAASPGLVAGAAAAAPEAAPVAPLGSCWAYQPGEGAEIGDLSGATNLRPVGGWGSNAQLELTSAGGTSVGRVRTFDLVATSSEVDGAQDEAAGQGGELLVGPAITAPVDATDGAAHYFFESTTVAAGATTGDPVPLAEAVEVELELEAGQTVLPLGFPEEAQGALELASAGDVTLTLAGVVFEIDDRDELIVCNGQEAGDPAEPEGDNPVTEPLPTNVTAEFPVVVRSLAEIDSITNQKKGATAARAGDRVTVSWQGLATDGPVEIKLCGPLLEGCDDPVAGTSGFDGSGNADFLLTDDAGGGERTIRVTELPPVEVGEASVRSRAASLMEAPTPLVQETPLFVLEKPGIDAASGATSEQIAFDGEGWDPQAEVRVSAHDGAGTVLASESFRAGDAGAVAGTLEGSGETAVATIEAAQVRAMSQGPEVYLRAEMAVDLAAIREPVDPVDEEPPPADEEPPGDDDTTTNTDDTTTTATPSAPTVTAPAAAPGAEIPETEALPVAEIPAPGEEVAPPSDIAVTSAELVGSTEMSDLFGGAPERTLRLRVENVGEAAVVAPGLEIAVGKDSPEPVFISDGVGRIEPGEVVTIEVPITLPVGAHGTYNITGRVGTGSGGEFALTWETWPWGLFGLNALGALLVAWALHRRFLRPAPALISAAAGMADPATAVNDGEAVIDLATLEQWWALQTASVGDAADAVVDEAAVERWLDRCQARELTKQ